MKRIVFTLLITLALVTSAYAADWNKPQLTDTYVNFLKYLDARLDESATFFDGTSPTNQPVGAKRYSAATKRLEYWTGSTWAALDMIGTKPFRGVLVYNNPSTPGSTDITWASELYDTDNIHSILSNTERLTVPAGVTKVKLIARISSLSGTVGGGFLVKNNTIFTGGASSSYGVSPGGLFNIGIDSAVLPVVGGDFFTVRTVGGATTPATTDGSYQWFAMEIIE